MKKLIVFLLVLTMLLGLAACSSSAGKTPTEEKAAETKPAETKPAEEKKEEAPAALPYEGVTLTLGMIPLTGVDEMTWYLEEVLPIFEAETGAKVEYVLNDG